MKCPFLFLYSIYRTCVSRNTSSLWFFGRFILFVAILSVYGLSGWVSCVHAAIIPTGDISPALPWGSSTEGYVGNTSDGTLTVNSGDNLLSKNVKIGHSSNVTGVVTVDGNGSTWNNTTHIIIGNSGHGTLNILDGAVVNGQLHIAELTSDSTGIVTVSGAGSTLTNDGYSMAVGIKGSGTLIIRDGATASSKLGRIGYWPGSIGAVTVDGIGSKWTSSDNLAIGGPYAGCTGSGTVNITNGGLISVSGGNLTIDYHGIGDSFINMGSGGMLALYGNAGDSLTQFYSLISGTDAIRWWDGSLGTWASLTTATTDTDYTLEYLASGALSGHTLLTVLAPVPEPCTLIMLLAAGAAVFAHAWRKRVTGN